MEKELRKELRKGEGRRIKNIWGEKTGRFFKNFGKKGALWVPKNDGELLFFRFFLNLAFRGAIFYGFYALFRENWIPALIVYIIIHTGLFIGGKMLEKKCMENLAQMSVYYNEKFTTFFDEICRQHHIVGDAFMIDNIRISNNRVDAYILPTKAEFNLYCLESFSGDNACFDRRLNPQPDDVDLKKHIASVEFNKKFGVITKKGMEMHCVDLLRPTVQVALCDKFQIEHLAMAEIGGGNFFAATKDSVKPIKTYFDIYGDDPLLWFFEDAEIYCEKMEKMGQKFYPEANFILTSLKLKP